MDILNKTILITGANRGIGKALVQEALNKGAKRVYAATRQPYTHPDKRVTPIILDVTNAGQIAEAAEKITDLDVLINNAGIADFDKMDDRAMISKHLNVNLYGVFDLTQAMLPLLINAKGAIVNMLSIAALAPLPIVASYSISKAAALSMTQSMRAFLAPKGVRVHAVMTGPVDTDMNRDFDIPKAPPAYAAQQIFKGVEIETEEIFPDPLSQTLEENWNNGAVKAMERQNAQMVA